MINYYNILKPDEQTTPRETRKKYLELIKSNHPDLFPPDKRTEQNYIMMEINEAYLSLLANRPEFKPKASSPAFDLKNNFIIKHKEPDYGYYRYALKLFMKGHHVFNNSRYSLNDDGQLYNIKNDEIIRTASRALAFYKESYRYFCKIIYEYPDSIWTPDSKERLNMIEQLINRYNRIIERINAAAADIA